MSEPGAERPKAFWRWLALAAALVALDLWSKAAVFAWLGGFPAGMEADHHGHLAQSRLRDAKALQRDCPEGCEGSPVERYPGRHAHSQVLRHHDELGMVRVARTCARDPIADLESAGVVPDPWVTARSLRASVSVSPTGK